MKSDTIFLKTHPKIEQKTNKNTSLLKSIKINSYSVYEKEKVTKESIVTVIKIKYLWFNKKIGLSIDNFNIRFKLKQG